MEIEEPFSHKQRFSAIGFCLWLRRRFCSHLMGAAEIDFSVSSFESRNGIMLPQKDRLAKCLSKQLLLQGRTNNQIPIGRMLLVGLNGKPSGINAIQQIRQIWTDG